MSLRSEADGNHDTMFVYDPARQSARSQSQSEEFDPAQVSRHADHQQTAGGMTEGALMSRPVKDLRKGDYTKSSLFLPFNRCMTPSRRYRGIGSHSTLQMPNGTG